MEQTRPQAPNALCSQVLSLKMCHNSLPQGAARMTARPSSPRRTEPQFEVAWRCPGRGAASPGHPSSTPAAHTPPALRRSQPGEHESGSDFRGKQL